MAFPTTIDTFLEAIDISDIPSLYSLLKTYQDQIKAGNFSGASATLALMGENGQKMQMTASRYNQVINAITAIQTFYTTHLEGREEITQWDSGTTYAIDSLVINDGIWYKAIAESTNQEPPNETYWSLLITANPAKQYPIQTFQPADEDQEIGELWFEVL